MVFHALDGFKDPLNGLAEGFFSPLALVDDLFPVPLVDVNGVKVVQDFFVFSDGVHVGEQAFTAAEAVVLEGPALPLGQGVNDLQLAFVAVMQGEGNGLFPAGEVVVQAGRLFDEHGRGNSLQIHRGAKFGLESFSDITDCLFGFANGHFRIIIAWYN
ncbi:hypothetical protein lacNasYZ03_16120 [Lactobacillus nasalidis]|uniref:Uncharacterized protein n=1 Tax=Lactobacillus nasalidis TaxID=2797258 RepID=A0ABQ3W5V1_9LACO|nr:hypothetical protein lacNasYZ03_16120 [Lactobacillus nasalidis]